MEKIIQNAEHSFENETAGFRSEEMIGCRKCGRKSPPNRFQCFYCGENLESGAMKTDLIKPNLRKLESWENGFNLIYLTKKRELNENEIREISKLLNFERELLTKLFEFEEILPIIRIESSSEIEIIKEKLYARGIETVIVSDKSLDLKNPVRRLRKIEFLDEKIRLTLFNKAENVEIARKDLVLIISGSIFEKKSETVEKYVKSKENKTLSIDETAKDEKIIDIYSRNDLNGYRISTSGFNFSCLEKEMSFLAFENIIKVFDKLKVFAPHAKATENYNRIRNLLSEVWENEATNESRGISKKGIGNFNLNRATIITNLDQFTKYSRLLRSLV